MNKPSLPLRLSAVPALAGMTVVVLAILSIVDLSREERRKDGDDFGELQVLRRERKAGLVPSSRDVPVLSEEEALRAFGERPVRSNLLALWPHARHRERLFETLLAEETPEETRLWLLGRFAAAEPARALEAARALARESEISQGPLRLSAYEVLARFGTEDDLSLFEERSSELPQTKALREGYRDSLQDRVHGTD